VSRQRGENKSLFFKIIPPYPLLSISIKGLEFLENQGNKELQLFQGQILKTKIVIKNQGKASASDLYLKFSHPSFVFEKCTKSNLIQNLPQKPLISLWGKSSTISKILESNEVILPGEEKEYEVSIRMTELGHQQVSILATYKCYNSQYVHDYTGKY
jgi:hypothetical protein